MEILVKKTTEEKVTIELPYYCKSEWFAYAIYSEKQAIQVHYGVLPDSASIDVCNSRLPFEVSFNCTPCTKDEFKSIYDNAVLRLDSILNISSLPEIQY